jgi:hypothetical protein
MVLTVSFVISLVIGLSCHHRRRIIRRLDIGVEISGPHDFAVRARILRLVTHARPSHPAANVS